MILERIKKSKNARTLASNFIYLSILKGISFIFPLITMPYLARVIGADSFGAIAFASSIIIIIETITDWGFNFTATRDMAQNRENLDIVSEIYSQVFYARIFLTIVCFCGMIFAIELIPSLREYKLLLLLTFLYIPGYILLPQWLFQAYERMRYITILSFISNIVFTALIFVVIRKQSDYVYQPLLNACGIITSGIIAQFFIFNSFKIKLLKPNFKGIFNRLKSSTNMFISLLLPNLYTNVSTILLKTYCGNFAAGIYNGADKFLAIIDHISGLLSRTFFPFLSRHKEKHYVYAIISGSIAVIASLLMFFGAKLFVHIFLTPEFADAVVVIKIFTFTPIFFFLINTYGTNYLVIIGKENIIRNIVAFISILGFVLTWILTPLYSFIGAAIAVTVVRGINGILTFIFAKKYQGIEKRM